MRVRKLDKDGDYSFGHGPHDYFVNQRELVAQNILTRLRLGLGEWFINLADGTPWKTRVLGKYTSSTYDMTIKSRILGTAGVTAITAYSSVRDRVTRRLDVSVTVSTLFGQASLALATHLGPPPVFLPLESEAAVQFTTETDIPLTLD